jgi:PAS domain-containing protein
MPASGDRRVEIPFSKGKQQLERQATMKDTSQPQISDGMKLTSSGRQRSEGQRKKTVPSDHSLGGSEKMNLLIAERTSDLIAIATLADAPTYVYISPSHKKILGYQPYDMVGKPVFDLVHPDDRERLLLLLKQYVQAKNENRLPQDIMGMTEKMSY